MRYMLDTCALIDALTDVEMLGPDVRALMEDYENQFCISQESIREVILKCRTKRMFVNFWPTPESVIDDINDNCIFTILPIKEEHLRQYARLIPNEEEDHKDPSDHLIISHAIVNKMPLISRDRKFHFYKSQGLELIYYGRKKK